MSGPRVPWTLGALTRRRFVAASGAAGATLYLGVDVAGAASGRAPAYLLRSSYTGRVGESFATAAGGLKLESVRDVAAAKERKLVDDEDAFVLTFTTAAAIDDEAHAFSHPVLGDFELYASPVGRPFGRHRYEAVIDRSVGARRSGPRDGGVASAPAGGAPAAAAGGGKLQTKKARTERIVRAYARRKRSGALVAEITFAPRKRIALLRARLVRDGQTVARGTRTGAGRRVTLKLTELRAARPGSYELVVTSVDRRGVRETLRRTVVI